MNYEKMYNDLKVEHETLQTTFNNFKTTIEKEKEDLQKEYDTYKENSEKEKTDLQQANIQLFLKIPKEPTETQKQQEVPEKTITCEDIIKDLGGK